MVFRARGRHHALRYLEVSVINDWQTGCTVCLRQSVYCLTTAMHFIADFVIAMKGPGNPVIRSEGTGDGSNSDAGGLQLLWDLY